ncbi:hypothetical protein IMSHALPRED_003515 [Imshaugia aleurites]|uniref:Solute carrier family 39 member 9 n=1 Tax=Imshaugia aleurites TaxID=172621 RepID=A0A8H3F0Y8_9LECA|nr:hypothetical protein IMSHALPRED_003515 [Imshaugia aleurites]
MAIASFLAGSLPLSFTLSQSRLRLISTIGMGVLIGTALIVIIPEGVETLYSASDYSAEAHSRRNMVPHANVLQRDVKGLHTLNLRAISLKEESADANPYNALPGPVLPEDTKLQHDDPDAHSNNPPVTPTEPGKVGILEDDTSTISAPSLEKPGKATESSQSKREPHAWIGLALICGFILMYLLDTLPLLAPPAPQRPHSNIYSLSELSTSPPPTPATPQRSLSTTLGLCIHAAADGIALGASSSSTSTSSLSLIIFVAIMVHKAPAAFGLTSVLLKQGLGKRAARAHLVIFSLAAPAGAVGTWVVVRTLGGGGNTEPALMKWWTGVLLLFSGGTFLWVAPSSVHKMQLLTVGSHRYVAMHTMQEEGSQSTAQEENQSNGYLELGGRPSRRPKGGRNPRLVLAAVGGMLLPLITQIGHAH